MKIITKKNFYILSLIVISLIVAVTVPTYAKFASNYITEDDMVGLSLDFSLRITNIEEYEQIIVAPGEKIKFNINVTNNMGALAYYGVWYRMVEPADLTSDISIGRLLGTSVSTSGSIDDNASVVVTVAIINNSGNQITVDIGVANSFTGIGDIEYLGGKQLIAGDILVNTYLNEKSVGSYVLYTGNNGCEGESCSGQNANYADDSNMGYCQNSNYKFKVNGWRVAYIEGKNVHLVSAGATDCMCTSSDGTASSSSCSSNLSDDDFYKHINNLDNMALKYCNKNYVDGGVCNNTVVWAMDDLDFQKITGREIESTTCFGHANEACGLYNSLIDNGGYYYFAKQYSSSTSLLWNPTIPGAYHSYGSAGYLAGVRPVIRLDSSVIVIGGTGTEGDPYIIANS